MPKINASQLDSYEINGGISGTICSEQTIIKHVCSKKLIIPPNCLGSVAITDVFVNDTCIFSLQKNGIQFATITFESSTLQGMFEGLQTEFNEGDIFSIVAPVLKKPINNGLWFTIVCKL